MTALSAQRGILSDPPRAGRYLFFSSSGSPALVRDALKRCQPLVNGESVVMGLGETLLSTLETRVPGLHAFPAWSGARIALPSTPFAVWCWLRGEETGELVHATQELTRAFAPDMHLDQVVDAFRYGAGPNGHGKDLTGYEDGTENPQNEDASAVALMHNLGPGWDGGSLVAVQQWVHDWDAVRALGADAMDHVIGRRRSDNEELADAPASAHVQRTAQERFVPEAFVLRRSMPWAHAHRSGLMFVAFGASLDPFEAQLHRMMGLDDGISDALFTISRPLNGAYFWCPPLRDGRLDLQAVGL